MKEGLIFVWTEKEYIADIINHFESKDIKYVENLVFVKLNKDSNLIESDNAKDPFNLTNMFNYSQYEYFTKCHSTLLIFRKVFNYL